MKGNICTPQNCRKYAYLSKCDPFIYYLFSVLKDLNRKEQLPVDELLARGAN